MCFVFVFVIGHFTHTHRQIHTCSCFTLKDLLLKEIIWYLLFVQNIQAVINELKKYIFGHFSNYLIKLYENHLFTVI